MKKIIVILLTTALWAYTYAQTKELRIEKDGFEWFLVKENRRYGALNFKGEILIPIEYDTVTYKPFDKYGSKNSGGFKVKEGISLGGYNIDGKYVIPTSRNYKGFSKNTDDRLGTYYYIVLQDGRTGICDKNGREVFIMKEPYLNVTPVLEKGYFYYLIEGDGMDEVGIADSKGDVVIKPKYYFVWIENNKFKAFKTDKDADNDKTRTVGSIPNNNDFHNPLSGNGRDEKEQMFRQIGFCPFEGKIEKSTDKLTRKAIYKYEKDGLKGVRDMQGKWLIPMCKEYRQMEFGNRKVLLVKNNKSQCGLYSMNGDIMLEVKYDAIEYAGESYVKAKRNSSWGVYFFEGNELIPISRGYTSISDFNTSKRTFSFTKMGYTGVCNELGEEISLTKLPPTADGIKATGGYASAVELKDRNTGYWKVGKGERYGLTDAEGKIIVPVEMEALESAGTGYVRYKLNGFWGLMNYQGKVLIDTNRGYTSIGDYKSFNKRFAYTMNGYKGECDATGKQISKIKVDTPRPNSSVASSSGSSASTSNSNSNNSSSTGGTQTIVVEHKHDPVPMQVWKQCTICYGSGKCQTCGGTGIFTGWSGNKTICEYGCGGSGKCQFCAGHGGHYEVEYR